MYNHQLHEVHLLDLVQQLLAHHLDVLLLQLLLDVPGVHLHLLLTQCLLVLGHLLNTIL